MKFYYVYVLYNYSKKFIYIGYSENLIDRFHYHNSGKVLSTKNLIPLQLIFYEAYLDKSDAKRRENYLKTNRGRKTLLTMLSNFCTKNSVS
ncbi:hypothetical protein A2160_03940 [Candidatus Beckwithbacteria bacterium RBG_13_42_9]|uniref:GIY-YIG domain-containing protein n=1 Tax=Candidatus Beckwithbacteria bacterium RBG_13_42_9 TaxID=1797457 RepID=A0A1F5E5P8_9BACT|nr:MAG: hypothetical protein A2160_03940 [Candidatus Beckwithbacteria bacterium RBG_13_42_9]